MGTAMVQVFITNPYELIKIRQQTVVGQPITETIKELGLRGLTKVSCYLVSNAYSVLVMDCGYDLDLTCMHGSSYRAWEHASCEMFLSTLSTFHRTAPSRTG